MTAPPESLVRPDTRRQALPSLAPSTLLAGGMTLLIALSVTRGLARGFVAISDDAQIALRARDVLTEHHPLVGMASSGSTPDAAFNHPGPLLFDVLALPVRLFGDGVGVAVGAAVINVVAVWGTVLTARRIAGETAATVVAVGVCALGWAMGSEVLYSVWNPNVVVLTFVWFVVCCWGVACGRWAFLPLAVGLGSLCAQSQLGYPIAVAVALAAALVIGWRLPLDGPPADDRRRWLLAGTAVLLGCWAQPLWEQFTSVGRGNISLILSAGGEATGTVGVGFGARILADVLSPTSWFRPEFDHVWFREGAGGLPGTALSVLLIAVAVAGVAWAASVARRRAPDVVRLIAVVAAVFVGGFVTMVRVPAQFGVALSAYYVRWTWPAVVLLLVALVLVAISAPARSGVAEEPAPVPAPPGASGVSWAAAGVGAVLLVLTVPTHGLATRRPYLDAGGEMRSQIARNVERVPTDQPVRMRFDTASWTLPYPYVVAALLDEAGVDIVVDEPFMVRQYGRERAAGDGRYADIVVQLGGGAPPRRARTLARVEDTPDGPLGVYLVPAGRG